MKDVPEIAPEIRGLLEEIVANPRSAIRLAPRRALRSWFDSGETIRATDVSRQRAARHLVEAHQEEIARLLREASLISYWKAPVLAHRPIGADGKPSNPTEKEPVWRRRVDREVGSSSEGTDAIALLRQCLRGVKAGHGCMLAKASLSLVPSDMTRFCFAVNVPWTKPRVAITLLQPLARRARPATMRPDILLALGARMCCLDLFHEARGFYRASSTLNPNSPFGRFCAFNLSCFLGEEVAAKAEAAELGKTIGPNDPNVLEVRDLLRDWAKTRSESELKVARNVSGRIEDKIPQVAVLLGRVFEQ